MLEKVRAVIKKYQLLSSGERIIVGFSGGIDSISLLHTLCNLPEYRLEIWAVYINHSLRPLETEREEQFVNEIGMKWGIQTKIFTINIPESLKKKPQSIQLLAREERYRIFEDFRQAIRADKIALAHHQDDQAETILYRIIRGTGLDGLAGIPIMRDGVIIRPLLEVTRQEIIEYATANKLAWLEDSSNKKTIYQRNKIRLQLIPLIEESYNPRFKNGLNRLAKLAAEQRVFMENLVEERSAELIVEEDERIGIRLEFFLKQPPYFQYYLLKYVLSRMQTVYHIETVTLDRLRSKINNQGYQFSAVHIFKGVQVYREGESIFFDKIRNLVDNYDYATYLLNSPGKSVIPFINRKIEIESASPPGTWATISNDEVYLDSRKLALPLAIRFWQPGDNFLPLGAPGSQKLHDYFINNKVPRYLRKQIPLLVTADNRIVWIIGYRVSGEFIIDSKTIDVWRVKVRKIGTA